MVSVEPKHRLGPGKYFFDDIHVGNWFETGTATITADEIRSYAELSGDCYDLHLNDEAAQKIGFPSLIAHGILIQGIADGLKFQSLAKLDAVASLGWEIKYIKPVFASDQISARVRIADKRPTSRSDRGIATLEFVVLNQSSVTVQLGYNKLMMRRRKRT